MLSYLLVRNLAVVDEVEIELSAGMTTLTGETGAGKSILLDALGLALGERADSDAVRPDAKRAEITATFDIEPDQPAARWLADNDLDEEGECVLRRVVTAEGRSRGYINGNPVSMQTLRELGDLLVDICGQQAHQSLVRADSQRQMLDQHGGKTLLRLLAEVRTAHFEWQQWQTRYTSLLAASQASAERIDLLTFQVQELEALNAQPGELEELEQAHRRAANASRITEGASSALQLIYENEQASAHDLISKARQQLDELGDLDPELAPLATLLSEAEIQLSETADSLRHYLDRDGDDADSLDQLEARLSAMLDLARKHRVHAAELPELTEQLREELHGIEHADDTLEDLRNNVHASEEELHRLCAELTAARTVAARSLEQEVSTQMEQLDMPAGRFIVSLEALEAPGANGAEKIEFLVSINPGMKPGSLSRVASGGELSRVSLAIQVATSSAANTPTLIFDEVDAGVGGKTADMVGIKLRALAARAQVLCVTHLPQVASKGHEQFRVSKLSDGQKTRTRVAHLTHDERVEEVARMLGGQEITATTRQHAAEMLGKEAV